MSMNKSMVFASMLAITDMLADVPGFRPPFLRRCIQCGAEIKTSRIDPFCDDYCGKKYKKKVAGTSWVDKTKKHKPWMRKKHKKRV